MAIVIKNNASAASALKDVDKNKGKMTKDLERLSSGMAINSAADDPAGLAISEKMRTQIRSFAQDDQNAQNGNSMMKVAEGAVQSTVDILRTLKDKAIDAANDTNTDGDRSTIQKEFTHLVDQLDDNAATQFNGKTLMTGQYNDEVVNLQPGAQPGGTFTVLSNTKIGFGGRNPVPLTLGIGAWTINDGRPLNIQDGDKVVISYVKNGQTITNENNPLIVSNTNVGTGANRGVNSQPNLQSLFNWAPANNDIQVVSPQQAAPLPSNGSYIGQDQYNNPVTTVDGGPALSIQAQTAGVNGQIAGLTIIVLDRYNQPRKDVNTYFNAFQETVRAQDTSPDNSVHFQIGTRSNQAMTVGLTDMTGKALGLRGSASTAPGQVINIQTRSMANAAINVLDSALQKALDQQTTLGAVQQKLNMARANVVTAGENTQNAESTIRDADMAKTAMEYAKDNVLTQAAQSMLAQANQTASGVLSLLR